MVEKLRSPLYSQYHQCEVTQKLVIKNGLWLISVSHLHSSLQSFVLLTSGIAATH